MYIYIYIYIYISYNSLYFMDWKVIRKPQAPC